MDRWGKPEYFFINHQGNVANLTMFRKNTGITLIELLIALVISSILLGALYQTFIRQQKTYAIQEQVVETQQNVRVAIDRMSRELRMAGYGGKILTVFVNVNGFSNIITPVDNANNIGNNDDKITIILADQVGVLTSNALKGSTTLSVTNADKFNNEKKKYLNLNGQNNYVVSGVSGSTITLTTALAEEHLANEPVNLVKAITYDLGLSFGKPTLRRDENTSPAPNPQPLAENIENLQFVYYDANGNITTTSADIRMIKVTVTARTSMSDPELGSGGGYRRRELTTSIQVRNMGL